MSEMLTEISIAIAEIGRKYGYDFTGLQGFSEPCTLRIRFSLVERSMADEQLSHAFNWLIGQGIAKDEATLQDLLERHEKLFKIRRLNLDGPSVTVMIYKITERLITSMTLDEFSEYINQIENSGLAGD